MLIQGDLAGSVAPSPPALAVSRLVDDDPVNPGAEGRLAAEILLEKMPKLALTPGARLRRQPNSSLRSWESLPIVFA